MTASAPLPSFTPPPPQAPAPSAPAPQLSGTSTWRLRPGAVRLVMSLELRQRVRSKRWYVALGIWFLFLLGMSLLIFTSFTVLTGTGTDLMGTAGQICFSLSTLLLVFTQMLVLPALSAGSINGDRSAGTLATLQATLLSAAEIVVGKILAGWVVGLAFLAAALPSLVPAALLGGRSPLYVLRVLLMIAVLSLLVTMMGVGMSALLRRQLGSVVLTYLVVIGTMVILPMIWVATLPIVSFPQQTTRYYSETYDPSWTQVGTEPRAEPTVVLAEGEAVPQAGERVCVAYVENDSVIRTDIFAPLLWVNPFVLVAATAPPMTLQEFDSSDASFDMLQLMTMGVRFASNPTSEAWSVSCDPDQPGYPEGADTGLPGLPTWPAGLAAWVLVGGGAAVLAVLRLRVPLRRVGTGTRIA